MFTPHYHTYADTHIYESIQELKVKKRILEFVKVYQTIQKAHQTARFFQKQKIISLLLLVFTEKYIPLQSQTNANGAGCSSARLEYASGGRVVAGSNPVIPTWLKP